MQTTLVLAQTTSLTGQLDLANLKKMLHEYVVEKGPSFAGNLLAAVVVLIVGVWCARLAAGLVTRMLRRAKVDETLSKFLGRLAQAMVTLVVVMAALDRVGVNTTSFAAVMAAVGLAIGMALQGSLSNFAAGVMIIVLRPFRVGDFIEAGSATGFVEEIHIFNTFLRTGDNIEIVIPNSAIVGGNISNYSKRPMRRIDLVVGCGYQDDLRSVKQFLEQLVTQDPRILPNPAPKVAVSELGNNSVNFVVRPWVPTEEYWNVRWDLTEAVKVGFDERGFTIPFPQTDIHIHRIESKNRSNRRPAPIREPLVLDQPDLLEQIETTAEDLPAAAGTTGFLSLMRPRRAS